MRTREEAERVAGHLNDARWTGQREFYTVDQSPITGAWRVIKHREVGYQRTVSWVFSS